MAEDLQAFLRSSVGARSREVVSGPFHCFFCDDDPLPFLNYAIPAAPIAASIAELALPALEEVFRENGRLARFEFVTTFAPELQRVLSAAGYETEPEAFSMWCEPADLAFPAFDERLAIDFADASTSDASLAASLRLRTQAFGSPDRSNEPGAVAEARHSAARAPLALATMDGEVAGAGSVSPVIDGVAEVAGIGVLGHYRRRGIGAALTAALALRAFHAGAERVFLTAGDREAAGVYARVGFRECPHTVVSMRKIEYASGR